MSTNIPDPTLPSEFYPTALYRVHFSRSSNTSYNYYEGFRCKAAGHTKLRNYGKLARGVKNHLGWKHKPTHFISTFRSWNHARNWARTILSQRNRGFARNRGSARIMKIDPQEITSEILKVSDIVEDYPELLPLNVDEETVDDEYLVLYEIPASAIIRTYHV